MWALVLGASNPLRNSLVMLLQAMPQLERVERLDDLAVAAGWGVAPVLVVLDSSAPGHDVRAQVARVRATWPQSHCLVLVDDVQQQSQAEAAGASHGLLKGVAASRLSALIEQLLVQPALC